MAQSNNQEIYYKIENNSQWHGPGRVIWQDGKQALVKHGSVYARVHACRITHTIDNDDNNGSNNIGDIAENAPNLSFSNSKYINQSNHLVTDSDYTDIEDNLKSDVYQIQKLLIKMKKIMTTQIMKENPITKRTLPMKLKIVIQKE